MSSKRKQSKKSPKINDQIKVNGQSKGETFPQNEFSVQQPKQKEKPVKQVKESKKRKSTKVQEPLASEQRSSEKKIIQEALQKVQSEKITQQSKQKLKNKSKEKEKEKENRSSVGGQNRSVPKTIINTLEEKKLNEFEEGDDVLKMSGVLDAYQLFLRTLCKHGLPTGDIYEFAAQQMEKYERKKRAKELKIKAEMEIQKAAQRKLEKQKDRELKKIIKL